MREEDGVKDKMVDGWLVGWLDESSVGKACFIYDGAALGGGDALSRTEHAGEQKLFDGRHHSTSEVLCVDLVKREIQLVMVWVLKRLESSRQTR